MGLTALPYRHTVHIHFISLYIHSCILEFFSVTFSSAGIAHLLPAPSSSYRRVHAECVVCYVHVFILYVCMYMYVCMYVLQFAGLSNMSNNLGTTRTQGVGRGGAVGTATRYGPNSPGIESRWVARLSAPVQTGPRDHPAFCINGTGCLS
jgi:hypothetical protein